MELDALLINFLGFLMVALAGYFLYRNAIAPRLSGAFGKRRSKEEWIREASEMLSHPELQKEDEEILQAAILTLERNERRSRHESWSSDDPRNAAIGDIKYLQQKYNTDDG